MKTWAMMYSIIWLVFFEIMLVMFLPVNFTINLVIHSLLGAATLWFSYSIFQRVKHSSCPARIKRITKTTWGLVIFQTALGVILAIGIYLSWEIFSQQS